MKVNAAIAFEDPKGRGLISFFLNDTTNTLKQSQEGHFSNNVWFMFVMLFPRIISLM